MDRKDEPLFSAFPPVSREEWEDQIRKDLKGADYEKKLVWKTLEGFRVQPYYTAEDLKNIFYLEGRPGVFPFVRGGCASGNDWEIRQDIRVSDPAEANRKALEALERGAEAIGFVFNFRHPGSDKACVDKLDRLVQGIDPEKVPLYFEGFPCAADLPAWLYGYSAGRGSHPEKISGSAGIDPLGDTCVTGNDPAEGMDGLAHVFTGWKDKLNSYRLITVHTSAIHHAGASLVQELAFGLAMGQEYLSFLTGRGFDVRQVAPRIQFSMVTGSHYFLEIAKLRAARYLWSRILEAWGMEPGRIPPMHLHCITSQRNRTIFDPYVNMLRSTTEAMAAVLGGTGSLSVEPFDILVRDPSAFSERIARNTQIILKEEAYFNKVADPAAGSYYLENLTDSMIGASWELFREVDRMGGFTEVFRKGWIQEQVEKVAAERDRNVALRKDVLVGTSMYANSDETLPGDVKIDKGKDIPSGEPLQPLRPRRAARDFDEIRMQTQKSGKRPRVLLLTYGDPAMRRARATFSWNFFACAGFEIIDHPGYASLEEGMSASMKNRADITVICSSDEEYPEIVPPVLEKLKEKTLVVVAGYPKEHVDKLREAGLKHFIHIGQDVPQALREFQKELGIIAS
ncbi:MAG: methylmalonyl-CoA mutase family protein [Bacteroidales bacterium]